MSIWANVVSERYDGAIAQLAMLIEACPDEHWSAPVWQVRRADRHVWPIVRGMGADMPDDERLQLQQGLHAHTQGADTATSASAMKRV
jgi:hypothetical protein